MILAAILPHQSVFFLVVFESAVGDTLQLLCDSHDEIDMERVGMLVVFVEGIC